MSRRPLREPSDVYDGRHRIGRLEPAETGVRAFVVDDLDGGELQFVGIAPTDREAQQLIAAARGGASAPEEAPAP